MAMNGSQTYPQPTQPGMAGYNPFFQAQPQQQALSINTAQFGGNISSNPFTRSPTRIQSPTLSQIPEQTQQNFYAQPVQPVQPQATNPFFNQMAPQAQQFPGQMQMQMQMPQQMGLAPQMTGYMQPQQQQFQQFQQPPRPDKASIMALYNYPQQPAPAQTPFHQPQDAGQPTTPAQTPNSLFPSQPYPQQQQQQQQQQVQQQPTPVSPAAMSKNPFVSAAAAATGGGGGGPQPGRMVEPAPPKHNVSRESMMAVGLEWSNGRHSPDAFASLSARDGR
jgi:hypothetical protein